MYCLALPSVCILMQNHHNRSMLGHYHSTSCHDGDVGDLIVVNSMDIHFLLRFLYDANIVASNPAICSPINKGTSFA